MNNVKSKAYKNMSPWLGILSKYSLQLTYNKFTLLEFLHLYIIASLSLGRGTICFDQEQQKQKPVQPKDKAERKKWKKVPLDLLAGLIVGFTFHFLQGP